MTDTVKTGIVGCGNISGAYLRANEKFDILDIVAVTDIDMSKAEAKAEEFPFVRAVTVDELLGDPELEFVINLTIPAAHYEMALRALRAGKSAYNEKPLCLERKEGRKLLSTAKRKKLKLGCAPDTFMGAGIQTCRKLIDDGAIGKPVAATAFMMGRGPEAWHPSPDFFYRKGGGPMFDMGPYYVTTLVNLLGPVRRVTGSARITWPHRVLGIEGRRGEKIPVEIPTHLAAVLDFDSGPVATLVTSFDIHSHHHPCIEIYGSEGSLSVPDPNTFGGPVSIRRAGDEEWTEVELEHPWPDQSRGAGVASMAYALKKGMPHRASGELAYHVLDVMTAVTDASEKGRHVKLKSTCERPAPVRIAATDAERLG